MKPTIEYNDDAQQWEANLPPGFRFASGPHSLIESATSTSRTAPAAWKREAKAELLKRVASDQVVSCECCERE